MGLPVGARLPAEELGQPGAGRDHHLVGGEARGFGAHAHGVAVAHGLDAQHALAGAGLCAVGAGRGELCGDGVFGAHEAGVALEVADLVALQAELRVARADAGRVEHLVRDAEALGAGDGAAHEVGLAVVFGHAVARREDEAAGGGHQRAAGARLELAPDGVRAVHQRHVLVAFADGQPRDARIAMRRAAVVRWRELVDAEHARPALRELVEGGRAEGAQADDDRVVMSRGTGHGARGFVVTQGSGRETHPSPRWAGE
ncbi:hypothetical protein D9M68_636710 [compost metagenome]